MPSFDIVSEVDMHEVANAVDQANREVSTRFDFKGSNANFKLDNDTVTMTAEADFQLKQMLDILQGKFSKRGVDIACLQIDEATISGKEARQTITLRQGLDTPLCKKIIKVVKDTKIKVQSAIQGEKIRITGKKRDDLQQVITLLRDQDLDMPLQFNNFRD
ncbi:MAG: YajQ family cyclic di-GMP-binding protein [Gammaproteobacteria bacterium]